MRAITFSLLAVLAALVGIVLQPVLPANLSATIGADAVEEILAIMASSMLAVTTFSLGVAVAAFNAAASSATPRASQLLVEDSTTQNVLATFVGAFLFSLVGIVVLRMGAYGEQGREVLFVVTIAVIVIVVAALLRWIDHLTRIGRMSDTIDRVEEAASEALKWRVDHPVLGCNPLGDGHRLPHGNHDVILDRIGYVQHIDLDALDALAAEWQTRFALAALPGTFSEPSRPAIVSERTLDEEQQQQVCACFTTGPERTFEQDPRFGIIVLSEIASRALSPAINDPGTAIAVISRLVRVLAGWAHSGPGQPWPGETQRVDYPHLFAQALRARDLYEDAFASIARDGAGQVEVMIHLQKALRALAASGRSEVHEEARRFADIVLERAAAHLERDDEIARVRALRDEVRLVAARSNP